MSNNPPGSIFDLNDALIIDAGHVRVERLAPQGSEPSAIYRKAFKATSACDYSMWTEYEIDFFHLFKLRKLTHVAQLAALSRESRGGGVAQTRQLETFDCGPDLAQWCRVQPRYPDGTVASHPFQHIAQYLRLMRACLVALKEIHQLNIVHGDIKQDNICLFYHPYPYRPDTGKPVQMDFSQLKLIDFAWSMSPDVTLAHPLPIDGKKGLAYQAPQWQVALEQDRQAGQPLAVKKLDYRLDLYSLGHMAESIADIGLILPRGAALAFDGARQLGARLMLLGNGKKPDTLPHDGLIIEIDAWLKTLPGPEAYCFSVLGAVANGQTRPDLVRGLVPPVTPLAEGAAFAPKKLPALPPKPTLPNPREIGLPPPVTPLAANAAVVPQRLPASAEKQTLPNRRETGVPPVVLNWSEKLALMMKSAVGASVPAVEKPSQPARVATPSAFPLGKVFSDPFADGRGSGPAMVVIPAGGFMMGSPDSEPGRRGNEGPQHRVDFAAAFALSKTTVTFDEWEACVKDGACHAPSDSGWGKGNRPVINVSWDDAQKYVAWLSKKTGKPYRLPTEAEWEYAARAGTQTAYYWGAQIGENLANCKGSGSQWSGKQTAPVGSFAANGFGLHDMLGNVWQWVQDCYHGDYNGAPIDGCEWIGSDSKYGRVLRGGSWDSNPVNLRAAYRSNYTATNRFVIVGLRVARTLP